VLDIEELELVTAVLETEMELDLGVLTVELAATELVGFGLPPPLPPQAETRTLKIIMGARLILRI
jgi:hypothetical protein